MININTYVSLICISLILLLSSCTAKKNLLVPNNKPTELDKLSQMMTGSFDSSEQAEMDSSYYNISLHMYPVWQDKNIDSSRYLYIEQALATNQDKPYRQRIYKLELVGENQYKSSVYSLNNESDFIGQWEDPRFFNDFDESILKEREGCAVFLSQRADGSYVGSTQDKDCKSSLRGASYATSFVSIFKDRIESWDQGFDEKGEQVWGATKGGYIFNRIEQ